MILPVLPRARIKPVNSNRTYIRTYMTQKACLQHISDIRETVCAWIVIVVYNERCLSAHGEH